MRGGMQDRVGGSTRPAKIRREDMGKRKFAVMCQVGCQTPDLSRAVGGEARVCCARAANEERE